MPTPPPLLPATSSRVRKRWFCLGVLLLPLLLLPVGILSCLRLGTDASTLRNSLTRSATGHWNKTIELRLGSMSTALGRTVLQWVDLDPEARAALSALRGAEVGVYRLASGEQRLDNVRALERADEAMSERGWHRSLAVVQGSQLVTLYLPETIRPQGQLRLCLAVLDHRQLVVVSVRGRLEPLAALALSLRAELPIRGRRTVPAQAPPEPPA